MTRSLTVQEQARVRQLSLRLRHIERQITPFMSMNKEQLEEIHPELPVENWRVYVILMETAGLLVNDLVEVLP